MSIEEQSIEQLTKEPASTPQPQRRWYTLLLSPLWLCLLFALIIRIWLIAHTHGVIDGDEVLVGIQAEHILRGDFPIYFYGQPYMGSLEAYFMAILFAVFGPSYWTLRLEPILLSLIVVSLTWKLAAALADLAHLPAYAKRSFMTIAALLAAIPPLYDGILELRTYGGYIETFILMLLLLLSALQLTRRWHAGASRRELIWRWAGIGFIVGLGFWIYPLIISAVIAAALWIIGDRIADLVSSASGPGTREGPTTPHPPPRASTFRSALLPILAAIPASLIGFFPALLWGATRQWQNIAYVLGLGVSANRYASITSVTKAYITCVAPRVISGAVPKEDPLLATLHSPLLIVGIVCLLVTTTFVALSFLEAHPVLLRTRQLAGLPLLFAACTALIFCTSKATVYVVISCNYDIAGRYATPLVLALPFFFATIFALINMYLHEQSEKRVQVARAGAQTTRAGASPAPTLLVSRLHFLLMAQGILFALLLAYVGTQAWTYGLTDPARTFQSAYCLEAPAENEPIIAYLQQQHVHYAWASNWLAYGIVFKTNGSIIAADPMPFFPKSPNLDRIPANTDAVRHADRPTLLVFVHHDDGHPLLLQYLDSQQVTYHATRFPSEPGIDVLVVTPISRTVSPFESPTFTNIFTSCND